MVASRGPGVSGTTPTERRQTLQADRRELLLRGIEIRAVEERIQQLFNDGLVRGSTHLCIGQEAVSLGIASVARPTDLVVATYRGHGIALALGVTPVAVMGEILGRVIGCAGGNGGSMHLSDMSVGLYPTSAIVGSGIPTAAGAALTAHVRGTDDAAIAIFGDGAANIGAFHEGLNLAAIKKLPVLFVCENNLYGEYSRQNLTTPVEDIASRAAGYSMPGVVVDGQDLDEVATATAAALARARAGNGPTLLEMKTYRYRGHSRSDAATYRPDGELEQWQRRDPLAILEARLVEEGTVASDERAVIEGQVRQAVEEAAQQALSSPEPPLSAMFEHVAATSTAKA